ncbi:MAG: tail fiber assembly protein [Desulfovibrio sp.]|uniref:tail fiber assembly protein n=1 Tax=Desulfovibrio sp. TaxID=885 RepID=UPI002A9195A8|nr:tail fiber assembly protein [Desulfovibrio sp.]MDY6234818.1 tail fiber assembly protein [Desulfovibrio sp.]
MTNGNNDNNGNGNDGFFVGRTFDGEYPPEAALWCNRNGALIRSLDEGGGYVIAAVPRPADAELERLRFGRLRVERDRRLSATDWMMLPDCPLDDALKDAARTYRRALRDLPGLEGAPWDGGGVETPWPEGPAGINGNGTNNSNDKED